jgi:hypothetical protein
VAAIIAAALPEDQIGTAEVTLEANPGTLDQANFAGFRAAGVTRVSIGAQSFRSEYLQSIGRIHSVQQIGDCFNAAKLLGFKQINIDSHSSGVWKSRLTYQFWPTLSAVCMSPDKFLTKSQRSPSISNTQTVSTSLNFFPRFFEAR